MGMFGDLMNKIFHAAGTAQAPADTARPGVVPESRVQAAAREGVPVAIAVPGAPNAPAAVDAPAASAAAAPMGGVDVAATLDGLAAKNAEKLDWRRSIVDLMKLVGMDSSFSARKALAADLGYSGDTNDSASMNIWLHKQVMQKLAENGGNVPAELLAH